MGGAMKKRTLPLAKVYRVLETGPVVLVTSAGPKRPNIMVMTWHMMMEFEPPLIGCIISNRNGTFEIVRKTKECVINVPTAELAEQVVGCGNVHGRRGDKFSRFGLTPVPASCVQAPLIAECYVNLECVLVDRSMVEKYNMFIFEVRKAWIDPKKKRPRTIHHRGNGVFFVAGREIVLTSKMK